MTQVCCSTYLYDHEPVLGIRPEVRCQAGKAWGEEDEGKDIMAVQSLASVMEAFQRRRKISFHSYIFQGGVCVGVHVCVCVCVLWCFMAPAGAGAGAGAGYSTGRKRGQGQGHEQGRELGQGQG